MKTVEIKGIGFPNKGAELLLVATLEQLSKRGFRAALEPYSPYEHKVRYPLYTKASIVLHGVNVLKPLAALPRYVRDRLGIVRSSEIDLALDASGYAYGDPWAPSLANSRILDDPSRAPLFLLPQSIGPFEKPESIKVVRKLVKRAKAIYAREPEGAKYLFEATGYEAPVIPDITFGLKVAPADKARDIVIIPNFQVLERRGDIYRELLIDLATKLVRSDREVTMLNHEGRRDRQICEDVVAALSSRGLACELIEPETGVEAKAILGNSRFVLTSRYHGLVSALSQAVPVAAIGWSYKYEAALALFGLPQVDTSSASESIFAAIQGESYSNQFRRSEYIGRLANINLQVGAMWNEILD